MNFFRRSAVGLLVLAGIVWLLTSLLLCMPGEACYLIGYGTAFLLSLPVLFFAGRLPRIIAIVLAILSLWGFGQNLVAALHPVRKPIEGSSSR